MLRHWILFWKGLGFLWKFFWAGGFVVLGGSGDYPQRDDSFETEIHSAGLIHWSLTVSFNLSGHGKPSPSHYKILANAWI